MARQPNEDPRVTDLRRYRKAREQAQREKARRRPSSPRPGQGFLGANPRAGLILAIVAVLAILFWLGPLLLRFL